MNGTLPRKGVIGTLGDAIEWLRRNPILIVAFFLYGLLDAFSDVAESGAGLLSLLGFFVVIYINGLTHVIGTEEAAGETSDIGRASTDVLRRFLSLIGLTIISVLVIVVGLFFLIVPGIYLAVRLSLAPPACVIDDQNAFESLATSWNVAKGNLLKLFGITVASALVVGSAMIATLLFTGLEGEFYLTFLAVSAVLTAVVSPIVQFAYARIYLENRPADAAPKGVAGVRRTGETEPWGATTDDRTQRGTDGRYGDNRNESNWGDEGRDDSRW